MRIHIYLLAQATPPIEGYLFFGDHPNRGLCELFHHERV